MVVVEGMGDDGRVSVYKVTRSIKKRRNSIYNALRSIYEDSIFVSEIAGVWPQLPLLANLRCGLWYSSRFESTCYFKSTDGHTNNCSFSTSRLNLHVALLAGQRGGCIIVDSTRRGKRFPDSMSKTIPIWACVMNRAIERRRYAESELKNLPDGIVDEEQISVPWDCCLHLPLWVSDTEKAAIEDHLEEWTEQLEACGADVDFLALSLRKPLRPLWISQTTLIWLNEVPDYDSWDFTPIILVSASATSGVIQHRTSSEFSWHYIPGAGDDEESWARGLSPTLFWKHVFDLIDSGPDLCNQKVADIVEKERVYRSQRGELSPQIKVKPQMSSESASFYGKESQKEHQSELIYNNSMSIEAADKCSISWIGSTNIAVGKTSDGRQSILACLLSYTTPRKS